MQRNDDRAVHGRNDGILKGKKHILFVAAVLMMLALVVLHVVFAHSIYKAGGFSAKNPLSYLLIGGLVAVAVFKLRLLRRFKNSVGEKNS